MTILSNDFNRAIKLLAVEQKNIKILAQKLSKKLYKQTPVIYVAHGFEGLPLDLDNKSTKMSKVLCWHHVVAEMNHNELLGWRTNVEELAVVTLETEQTIGNKVRIDLNKKIIAQYTSNI